MVLFQELKRRNVFRVGIAYAIVARLLLQVADLVLENIDAPEWVMQAFMLALVIGLPLALLFAWAFELTPEGIKREHEVDRSQSITHQTGRKLDRTIIVVLVLALAYFMFDKYGGSGVPAGPSPDAATAARSEAKSPDGSEDGRRSIAVLPFANRSNREEDQFFSDGIHDDLLTSLAKVGSLKVISRTSVMRYRDTEKSIPEIARELGVATVMEGGIQRAGDQVRINVQLIDAQTDEHLWAEHYDRDLTAENLFAIQSDISREIVGALQATLSDEESERLASVPTDNLEAYGEFVLGRREMAKRTIESLERAHTHFEKAIELDPGYALAQVGLADSLALLANYGDLKIQETYLPRQLAVDRALAIDPKLGEAYTSLGNLRYNQFQDEEAERYFRKALELSPGYATAYHWYALLLDRLNRDEEALALTRKALELDPMAPILTTMYAATLADLGRMEEAMAALREGIGNNPEFPNNYSALSGTLLELGRVGEAALWNRRAVQLPDSNVRVYIGECTMYIQLGDAAAAENCLNSVEESFPQASVGWRALLYQFRGQYQEALEDTRQWAVQNPSPYSRRDLAWNYMYVGEAEKARALIEQDVPEYFADDQVSLLPADVFEAGQAAWVLWELGENERAGYLFDQALATMKSMHRTRGISYGSFDTFIHTVRGNRQKAIDSLREAIDAGWREDWWRLRHPLYDNMLEQPEWVALITELEADVARQRQWFENHKDDPVM